MNILFLLYHGFSEHSGISKKINSQVNGLKENGHNVTLCYYTVDEDGVRKRMVNDRILERYKNSLLGKIRHRLFFNSISQFIVENNIELVYMRSIHNANPFTIYFLKKLKKKGVKVVMEIPTYPYDDEYREEPLKYKLELLIDKIFRNSLTKQLERVVTFSNYKTIFGRETIQISNGVDFKSIKVKSQTNDTSQQIILIGVAEVHYWHGFDRLLKGIGEYYKKEQTFKVFFYLIGGLGPLEEQEYKKIVAEYQIDKYVKFFGTRFGQELDSLFDQSDMGVGSLARHRSNIINIKTIKNREYAARGIPFIYSEIDDDFENMPYILKAPANDSPINLDKVIEFYKKCNKNPKMIRESIKRLSWKEQMQKVINTVCNK